MILPNTPEPLVFRARNAAGEPVTGLSVTVKVFNPANGQIWDWATSAFSASPSQPTVVMTEVSAGNLPGYYYRSWPGAAAGYYLVEYSPPAGETADDYPTPVELRVSGYARTGDAMALTSGERSSVGAAVWAVLTPNPNWTYGACIELGRKSITNRLEVTAVGGGTETLYDDDAQNPIVTHTVRDSGGRAISTPTGSPALRGAAS